jgi:hypothetical protein
VKLILTVSPVPLVATAESRHVVESTCYSKSVLRVASEIVRQRRRYVAYFPSYEIITGSFTRGSFFAPDCRSVTEDGVAHVMRIFLKHFAKSELPGATFEVSAPEAARDKHLTEMARLVELNCDEEVLDREAPKRMLAAKTA